MHLRENQHLCERRVEWELNHFPAQLGQHARVIQRTQGPKLVHRVQDVVLQSAEEEVARM
jgi:hypothetical protein